MRARKADTMEPNVLESQVLEVVKDGGQRRVAAVVKQLSEKADEGDVRKAVRSLVDKGTLEVTLDWSVRAAKR